MIEAGRRTARDRARSARSRATRSACPTRPDQVFASMGNYVFSAAGADRRRHARTRTNEDSTPRHRRRHHPDARRARRGAGLRLLRATTCPASTERERGYWRDVGTLDAYYDAHMDLVSVDPIFNLYNRDWPIHSWPEPLPPAKFVFEEPGRTGQALDSMVCAGVIVSGGTRPPLGALARRARAPRAAVEDSVLMHGVEVGRGRGRPQRDRRQERRDRARAPRSASTSSADRERFVVSAGGIVVIGKGERVAELDARRPAHPRVPARGLRRRRRARRVPRARAGAARRRHRALLGRRRPAGWQPARRRAPSRGTRSPGTAPHLAALRADVDRPDDGRRRSRAPTSCTATPGTRTSAGTWPSCCTGSRTSRPCTASSRCGRGRRSSSAAATRSRASASAPALEAADAIIAVSAAMRDDILAVYPAIDPARVDGDPQRHRHRASTGPIRGTDVLDALRHRPGRADRSSSSAGSRARRASPTCSTRRSRSTPPRSSCSAPARPTRPSSAPRSARRSSGCAPSRARRRLARGDAPASPR